VDPHEAPVAGATAAIVSEQGAIHSTVVSDETGRFTADLPPAQYELRVSKAGFNPTRQTLFISRGANIERRVRLEIRTVSEAINVAPAAAPTGNPADGLDQAKSLYQQGHLQEVITQTQQALARLLNEASAARKASAANGSASSAPA